MPDDMGDRVNATDEERRIYALYTASELPFGKEKGLVFPGNHIFLVVGHQTFPIACEGPDYEMDFLRWMLAKALASFLHMERGTE